MGAAIQRGLEPGSRGTVIVGSATRQLLVKTLRAGEDSARALVICKMCKLEMAL
jgi:hypothetical protein